MRGKIITIEGPDASGKKTQTKLLIEALRRYGYSVETMSFPRYETPTGKKVRAYLNGEFGNMDEVDPHFAAQLYSDDRLAAKPDILELLNKGTILVFDRYTESNLGHQAAKFKDKDSKKEMIDWIRNLENDQMGLPKSDIVIYLSVPLDYMLKGMATDKRIKDLHESDKEHLLAAKETYDMLAEDPTWVTIDCVPLGGNERYPIDVIQKKVLDAALAFLIMKYTLKK